MPTKILRPAETAARVGYSPRHISRLERAGKFPARVKLNRAVGHVESEIEAWLQERIQASRLPVGLSGASP